MVTRGIGRGRRGETYVVSCELQAGGGEVPECSFVFAPDGAGGEVRGDEDVDGRLHEKEEQEEEEGDEEGEVTN